MKLLIKYFAITLAISIQLLYSGKIGANGKYDLALMPDGEGKVEALIELGETYCTSNFEQALLYLQEALVISTSINYSSGVARSLLYQGLAYFYKEEFDLAINYSERSRLIFEELKDFAGLASYHVISGRIHLHTGNFLKATENFQKVVEIALHINDKSLLYDGYCLLGTTHLQRLEPLLARPYLYEATKIAEEIEKRDNLFRLKADFYEQLEIYDSALVFRNELLRSSLKSGHQRGIASSEYTKARVLVSMGSFGEAIKLLESSHSKFRNLKDHTGICISALELFKAHHHTGNNQKAIEYEKVALNHALESNNPNLLSYTYANLAPVKASAGKYQEAYQYLSKHDHLKDSLDKENKERILKEMEVAFQTAKKDSEIAVLKSKEEINRKNILILVASGGALFLVVVLLILVLRFKSFKMKRTYLLMEKEKTIRDQEKKLSESEQLLLKEQLEAKNRELGSKALEMLRINETLKEIIEKLEKFENESVASGNTSSQLREISSGLEMQLKNNSWTEFEKIFNNIHSVFFEKLLEACPDISPTEIKIAALLKLNLTTKEIAAITFKSEAGIKSARFRLRQKLGLVKDDNLVPFLMHL